MAPLNSPGVGFLRVKSLVRKGDVVISNNIIPRLVGGVETEKCTVSEREVKRKKPQKHSATQETEKRKKSLKHGQ